MIVGLLYILKRTNGLLTHSKSTPGWSSRIPEQSHQGCLSSVRSSTSLLFYKRNPAISKNIRGGNRNEGDEHCLAITAECNYDHKIGHWRRMCCNVILQAKGSFSVNSAQTYQFHDGIGSLETHPECDSKPPVLFGKTHQSSLVALVSRCNQMDWKTIKAAVPGFNNKTADTFSQLIDEHKRTIS